MKKVIVLLIVSTLLACSERSAPCQYLVDKYEATQSAKDQLRALECIQRNL